MRIQLTNGQVTGVRFEQPRPTISFRVAWDLLADPDIPPDVEAPPAHPHQPAVGAPSRALLGRPHAATRPVLVVSAGRALEARGESAAKGDKNLALLIIWCFISGFSEKLVPSILSKTEEQANLKSQSNIKRKLN